MNIELEKKNIMAALQYRNEEWLLTAIKSLLEIQPEQSFGDEHKAIIMERIEAYEQNPGDVLSFDDIKKTFRKEGKWL